MTLLASSSPPVQGIAAVRIDRTGQGIAQLRIQGQHLRQGAIAVDTLLQSLRVQLQLALELRRSCASARELAQL